MSLPQQDTDGIRFEREKAAFEQNSEHLRSLNQLLWQVPLLAMTLTGGAWYGVAQLGNVPAALGLLLLVGIADIGLIVVMVRVRFVFERILTVTKLFHPEGSAATSGHAWYQREGLVVCVFSVILGLAAAASIVAAFTPAMVPEVASPADCQNQPSQR